MESGHVVARDKGSPLAGDPVDPAHAESVGQKVALGQNDAMEHRGHRELRSSDMINSWLK